ncbi:MAG: 30S ribosomal protein S15 [Candidatus Magasanikbacteria bacterium]
MSLSQDQKESVIEKYQKHDNDTGSATVQVGLLTKRINKLVNHLKEHPKDHNSRRGLLKMVGKRRRLLKYLKRENEEAYEELSEELGVEV